MKWNIYRYSINEKKIVVCNIFDHSEFLADVKKALKNSKTKEEMAKAVERSLRCYCWGKYEWEVIISPFTSLTDRPEIKVDAYEQIKNNWDIFIDYIWSHKKVRKAKQPE